MSTLTMTQTKALSLVEIRGYYPGCGWDCTATVLVLLEKLGLIKNIDRRGGQHFVITPKGSKELKA